ncbi:MAG: YicC family protein [Candidatus Kapabacteria bacterium]|nr:YicC family protein [Candidatus Kapabacteria bacterium]
MLKSMTGFSKAEITENGIKLSVELRSINNRFLEINTRLPRTISHKELEIKDIIKKYISRGSISVFVNIEYDGAAQPFFVNEKNAETVYKSLVALRKKLKMKGEVELNNLLQFSSFFTQKDNDSDGQQEFKLLEKCLSNALKELDKMRSKEGNQILKDFNNRLKNITSMLDKIESLSLNRIPEEREKLRRKVALLFESDEIDENRIQMEIAFLANRLDISEECVRLRSHIKFFKENLKNNQQVGQKLTFLLQEMNREINTIGSKADDADISQLVVSFKEELERIREQLQNIE